MFPENPTPSLVVLVFCVCDVGLCFQVPLLGRGADTVLLSRTCFAVGGAAHLALNPQVPIFPEVDYPGQRSTCNYLLCTRHCTSSVCTLLMSSAHFPVRSVIVFVVLQTMTLGHGDVKNVPQLTQLLNDRARTQSGFASHGSQGKQSHFASCSFCPAVWVS